MACGTLHYNDENFQITSFSMVISDGSLVFSNTSFKTYAEQFVPFELKIKIKVSSDYEPIIFKYNVPTIVELPCIGLLCTTGILGQTQECLNNGSIRYTLSFQVTERNLIKETMERQLK